MPVWSSDGLEGCKFPPSTIRTSNRIRTRMLQIITFDTHMEDGSCGGFMHCHDGLPVVPKRSPTSSSCKTDTVNKNALTKNITAPVGIFLIIILIKTLHIEIHAFRWRSMWS